jgi:hypothetical protein
VRLLCIASLAALAAVTLPSCASDLQRARKTPRAAERTALIYNGATVEGKVANSLQPTPPAPLETEDEQRARKSGLSLQAMPCDVLVESVPHGISVTFFAKAGGGLEAREIREQVALLTRVHNKMFQLPDATVEGGPESVPLALDSNRPDHAPLRALMAIPSRATFEDTQDGAKLVLTADSEKDLADLRAHVRWNAPELLPELMSERKRCPDIPVDVRAQLYNE